MISDLFSAMFVDSKIAKNIVVGRSKLKYEINKGINPYLIQVSKYKRQDTVHVRFFSNFQV